MSNEINFVPADINFELVLQYLRLLKRIRDRINQNQDQRSL